MSWFAHHRRRRRKTCREIVGGIIILILTSVIVWRSPREASSRRQDHRRVSAHCRRAAGRGRAAWIRAGWSTIGCGWRSTRAARFCRSGARQSSRSSSPSCRRRPTRHCGCASRARRRSRCPSCATAADARARVGRPLRRHRPGRRRRQLAVGRARGRGRAARAHEGGRAPTVRRAVRAARQPHGLLRRVSAAARERGVARRAERADRRARPRQEGADGPVPSQPHRRRPLEIATTGRAALVAGSRPLRRMGGRASAWAAAGCLRAGLRRRQALRALQDPDHRSEDGRARRRRRGGRADFSDDEGGGPAAEAEPTATLRTFRTGSLLGYRKKGWAKDVFFAQNLTIAAAPPGGVVAVGDVVVATPRRRPSWLAWGVRGVDYA